MQFAVVTFREGRPLDARRCRRAALGAAGRRIADRLRRIEQRPPCRGELFREKSGGGHLHEGGIGDVLVDVGLGDLDRLDHRMQGRRRIRAGRLHVHGLDQVGAHQHFEAAAGGRGIAVDVVATIGGVQWRRPLGRIGGQVGGAQHAAVLAEEAVHLLGDVAFVEAIGRGADRRRARRAGLQRLLFGLDQLAERRGVVGVLEKVAGLERRAAGHEDRGARRVPAEVALAPLDGLGQHRVDRIAELGRLDRRREDLGHRHGAEPLERRQIAAEVAGHDAGLHAGVQRLGRHLGRHDALRRGAGHRHRPHGVGGLVEHGHEAVAADAVHLGLAEPGHGADRGDGVEGVAALDEDLQPRRGGDWMARSHQAVPAGDGRPGEARPGRGGRLRRLLLAEHERRRPPPRSPTPEGECAAASRFLQGDTRV